MTTMLTIMLTTIAVLSLVINAVQHAKSKSDREYIRQASLKDNTLSRENDSLKRELEQLKTENASLEVLLKVEQVEARQCRQSLKIAEQSGKDCEDCADNEPVQTKN